jgi:hypothetical protein
MKYISKNHILSKSWNAKCCQNNKNIIKTITKGIKQKAYDI